MTRKSNNPNGRPRGAVSKITREIRETILEGIMPTLQEIPEILATLPIDERIEVCIKLLRFVIAVPQAPAIEDEADEKAALEERFPTNFL